MNKGNAAQYLPLVQALAEGKTLEFRANERQPWQSLFSYDVTFAYKPECYRVKPEPLVRWVVKGNGSEYNYQYEEAAIAKAECLSRIHYCEYAVHKMVEEL